MISWILFLSVCVFGTTMSVPEDLQATIIPRGVTNLGNYLLKSICENAKADQNVLISPLNIYTALALTHMGSTGTTRHELVKILGLPHNETGAKIHEALSAIVKTIEAKADKYNLFTETIFANGLFVQQEFPIRPEYVKNVKSFYQAEAKSLDFAHHAKNSTDVINKWVSDRTKGRIPQLFGEPIDPSTTFVLTSALYFSGKWNELFPSHKTKSHNFTTADNKQIEVQLMNSIKRVPYIKDLTLQYEAIRIPYEKEEYEMIIVLPTTLQTLSNLVTHLQLDDYKKLFDDPGTEGLNFGVDYKIPKMKFSWSHSIKDNLSKRGLKTFFTTADFSKLVSVGGLRVSDVTHATTIEVDEEGSKASAVTGIKFVPYIASVQPRTPRHFKVDRPFLMMIYNRPTSTLLFHAYVNNPVN